METAGHELPDRLVVIGRVRVPSHLLPDDKLIPFLERDLANHLGPQATSAPARAVLAALVRPIRSWELDPRDPQLMVEIARGDLALDAVMAMTGASFANGRLRLQVTDGPQVVRFRAGAREHVAEVG